MTVLFGLASALLWGAADFVGGLGSRRTSPWAVALVATGSGAVFAGVLALLVPGSTSLHDLAWGAAAGVGGGIGGAMLYRGLSSGRMGVVAPLSGVAAAIVPVAVALGLGERLSPIVWTGVAIALPAIWLVSRSTTDTPLSRAAVADGLFAGAGFGVAFAGLAQVSGERGFAVIAVNLSTGAVVVLTLAVACRASWVPTRSAALPGTAAGMLSAAAMASYVVAAQIGPLSVAAILSSLYPAGTVLLALLVLREHLGRSQAAGLALCLAAVGLVASG